MVLPIYTNDQIADYLISGYWAEPNVGFVPHHFDVTVGGTIYVNFSGFSDGSLFRNGNGDYFSDPNGISGNSVTYATAALAAWSEATGLNFVTTTGSADIYFSDNQAGAFGGAASAIWSGGEWITNLAIVNVEFNWWPDFGGDLDTYWFMTYMHEIGHALGLGHAGNYDVTEGPALFDENGGGSNHYLNDSWQATLMSYFDQIDNTWINADYGYALTPMMADIIAIREMYGSTYTTRSGNTVYGYNSNATGAVGDWRNYSNFTTVLTIIDDGGIDIFDFSDGIVAQLIDLREEAFSNVYGEVGTIGISRGTVIEKAFGGSHDDVIRGNSAANVLRGNDGNDTLHGNVGDDELYGGNGDDFIFGGKGADTIAGNSGIDTLSGGGANDVIRGGTEGDILHGNSGRDWLYGQEGDDFLYGDTGRDVLVGGSGNDYLSGGNGNDRLNGQAGDDIYFGGAGADKFIFNGNHSGDDLIVDYHSAENDVILIRNTTSVDSFVAVGNDIIITVGSQVITVTNGVIEGLLQSDLVFA